MSKQLPSAIQAKAQAKRLRARMAEGGSPIEHAKSLEFVAHQHGFRDWNTMLAAIGNGPPKDWVIGDTVTGTYLSQPFTAKVIAVAAIKPDWFRLELHFDEAVDVVTFDSFSNIRTRVRSVVGPKGHSIERTSDGQAHLQIDL